MRIAVIGAGNVGGTLGRRWAALGHDVAFGVRRPSEGASAVKGGGALPSNASVVSHREAVRGADAVLIATPWAAELDTVREIAADGALDGVPLLDAVNPIGPGFTLDIGADGLSGGERVQRAAPKAKVVKVFNTTGFDNMRDPSYDGQPTMMLYAGDDADAKRVAATLASTIGFESLDAGGLDQARHLEHFAMVWIGLAMKGGLGRNFAFRVVRR